MFIVASSGMDSGPTPFMIGQAMDMSGVDFNTDQDGLLSVEPAWMADINEMDWVSQIP